MQGELHDCTGIHCTIKDSKLCRGKVKSEVPWIAIMPFIAIDMVVTGSVFVRMLVLMALHITHGASPMLP